MKKQLHRRQKEIKFLQNRLDSHGDDWRNVPIEEDVKPVVSTLPSVTIKTEKVTVKNEKGQTKVSEKSKDHCSL